MKNNFSDLKNKVTTSILLALLFVLVVSVAGATVSLIYPTNNFAGSSSVTLKASLSNTSNFANATFYVFNSSDDILVNNSTVTSISAIRGLSFDGVDDYVSTAGSPVPAELLTCIS